MFITCFEIKIQRKIMSLTDKILTSTIGNRSIHSKIKHSRIKLVNYSERTFCHVMYP